MNTDRCVNLKFYQIFISLCLIKWWSVVLQKVVITPVVNTLSSFVKPEGLLSCSQNVVIEPYPEPAESSANFCTMFLKVNFNSIFLSSHSSLKWYSF